MKLNEQQLAQLAKAGSAFMAMQEPDVVAQVEAYKRQPVTPATAAPTLTRAPARIARPIAYRPRPAPYRGPLKPAAKPKASLATQLGAGVLVLLVLGIAVQLLVAFAPVVPYILGFLFIMGLGIHSKGGRHR